MKADFFSEQDLRFLQQRGSSPDEVARQFDYFTKGFTASELQKAATVGEGIVRFTAQECEYLLSNFAHLMRDKHVVKFVPASGAASRMFKEAFSLMENTDETLRAKAQQFLRDLKNYAFYEDLKAVMAASAFDIENEIEAGNYPLILKYLLTNAGMDYGNKPKAVLKFHRYATEIRTALEEHLVEAALYARSQDNHCHIHFTISSQHKALFENLLKDVQDKYEHRFGVTYDVEFSTQHPATDTLAATENNLPFRDHDGRLLFRPGGHGALIRNLNNLRADVVFVKNIDNVFYEHDLNDTVTYKKLLAAYLLSLQDKIFSSLRLLQNDAVTYNQLVEIAEFAREKLMICDARPEAASLFATLNRPLRVCGMVKNEGEPGGGPYFVKNRAGEVSLQIVESSQMNLHDPVQRKIVNSATHFNPVDMVCAYGTFDGKYFDLSNYIDPETGFISSKSYEGKSLKAMELPGLWNGAMAKWITIFVEVPLTTFHPVKTMFDLLK